MYACMYIGIYTYTHTQFLWCMYIYIHIYICTHTHIYIHTRTLRASISADNQCWLLTYMDRLYKWFDKKQEVVRSRPAGLIQTIFPDIWCKVSRVVKAQELGVKGSLGKVDVGHVARGRTEIPDFCGKTSSDCDPTTVAYGRPLAFVLIIDIHGSAV